MQLQIRALCMATLVGLAIATTGRAAEMKDFLGLWIPQDDSCDNVNDGGEYQGFVIKKNGVECGWGCDCSQFKVKVAGDKLSISAMCTNEDDPNRVKLTISATYLKRHYLSLGFDDVAATKYKYCESK